MIAFVMVILIMLPPTSAVNRSHPLHKFTITSTAAYMNVDKCFEAAERTLDYIQSRLPLAKIHPDVNCAVPVAFES